MAIFVNDPYHEDRYRTRRRVNNIYGLLCTAVLVFVAGIVISIMTGVPYYGGSICSTAVILGFLGFYLLFKYRPSGRVTTVTVSGGNQTTVQSSMTHSYQNTVRTSRTHSVVSVTGGLHSQQRGRMTDVQRSSSMARLQDPGVLGWGGTPSSQPVDNGWMAGGSQSHGGFSQPQYPPPPLGTQPGMASRPGGYTHPGPGPTQPGGYNNPDINRPTAGGYTYPVGPLAAGPGLSSGPGPSSYPDAPPSYDDAVQLQGKS